MRGTVAKRLRKKAYGDLSTKRRKYRWDKRMVVCADVRATYLNLKQKYYRGT